MKLKAVSGRDCSGKGNERGVQKFILVWRCILDEEITIVSTNTYVSCIQETCEVLYPPDIIWNLYLMMIKCA